MLCLARWKSDKVKYLYCWLPRVIAVIGLRVFSCHFTWFVHLRRNLVPKTPKSTPTFPQPTQKKIHTSHNNNGNPKKKKHERKNNIYWLFHGKWVHFGLMSSQNSPKWGIREIRVWWCNWLCKAYAGWSLCINSLLKQHRTPLPHTFSTLW